MKLHEYQSKFRFAQYGIPIPVGKTANTPREVFEIARDLACPVVVKAQVLTGSRAKAGGIRLATTPELAEHYAHAIFGMRLNGLPVRRVLVDPAVAVDAELYLSVTHDRSASCPVMIACAEGGVDIEQIAAQRPEAIAREWINPLIGFQEYQARILASSINLPFEYWRAFSQIALGLVTCYLENDATLAEINPLAITRDHRLVALDGKMIIDDNALPHHPELAEMRDVSADAEEEIVARAIGISYVRLGGQIGCLVNGAGLAMIVMDMIHFYGGSDISPANFLDIGGGAKASKVAAALRIILDDPQVKCVLVNVFGGITRCDEVAHGILQTLAESQSEIPMIVRLAGTYASEGHSVLEQASLPYIQFAAHLTEAVRRAVDTVRGVLSHDNPGQS